MGLELHFDVDVLDCVEFAVVVGVDEQYCDVHFSAIAIVDLYYFTVIVDNI